MGGIISGVGSPIKEHSEFEESIHSIAAAGSRWVEENKRFQDDMSLIYDKPNFHELRALLEDTVGQSFFGKFCMEQQIYIIFQAWIDMEEFKKIPSESYRLNVAKRLANKYLRDCSQLRLVKIPQQLIEDTVGQIDDCIAFPSRSLPSSLFVKIQNVVFRCLSLGGAFLQFKESAYFKEYEHLKATLYNRVTEDDFNYYKRIGEGAFGYVALAKKKSTGHTYAIKVISKRNLLEAYEIGPNVSMSASSSVCMERNVYANTSFPFILDMHYSFHNESDCLVVLEFASGGTLSDLVDANKGKLPEEWIRFIIAELACALHHMHCMNFIHRDVKASNILLDAQGHVKLGDMGLVAYARNESQAYTRHYSKVGTIGYKAPEILSAKRPVKEDKKTPVDPSASSSSEDIQEEFEESESYGPEVDWWAMGVLMLRMLIGKNIFVPGEIEGKKGKSGSAYELKHIYAVISKVKDLAKTMSPHGLEVLMGLLDVNPKNRMGIYSTDRYSFLLHPWFESIDCDELLELKITPPYSSSITPITFPEFPLWENFGQMAKEAESRHMNMYFSGLTVELSKRQQDLFQQWDYVSPIALKLELECQQRRAEPYNQ